MLKKVLGILISIVLILSVISGTVFASLQSEKAELQDKVKDAQSKKADVQLELSATQQEIDDLNTSIEENETKLEELSKELETIESEIKDLEKELAETQEQYEEQDQLLQDRITAQYEAGETTFLDVLLNSTSFTDFLSNYYLVSEILENDSDLLESIENQKLKIENDKKEIEEKQKEVKTKKAEQEKTQVLLNNQKVQKQNKVASLSEEEQDLQKEIENYKREINNVEKKIQQASSNADDKYNGSISGSGVLSWPLPSGYGMSYITSYFGNREQPVPGASTYHRAIDIGVPIGTPVYSAADGYVMLTGSSSVRGKYIMVKHADNLYTFYQHLSSVTASAGQNVKEGQTIAYSGNTGIGSGPHLHFEVRTSPNYGSEVNPLNYL